MIADEDTFPDESEFARLNKNAVLRHRNQVIEECAKVAESTTYMSGAAIAAAIRALKWHPEVDALDGLIYRTQKVGNIQLSRDNAEAIIESLHCRGYKIVKDE